MLFCALLLIFVLDVGSAHGLVKLHEAVDPVEDGNQYIIALEHNKHVDEFEEKVSELTANNDTFEYEVLWKIETGLKFLFVQMNEAALNAIREYDDIAFIEQDGWLHIQNKSTKEKKKKGKSKNIPKKKKKDGTPTDQWGLDRIDQRNLPLNGVFSVDPSAGKGASIYIVGTGIFVQHEDFGGRASNIYDYRGENFNGRDCNGHGTHLASIAAGNKYGVAKNASIYGMRITRCRGSGKMSDAVKAMQWLSENYKWPGVALIGVGSTGDSPSLDNAIHRIYLKGCMVILPAGNNNSLACDVSPGRMKMPITVAASTRSDYPVYFSNQGSCVDIIAPGMGIEAAYYHGSKTYVESLSGTSVASAYVTGAVAMHMGNGMPPFKIKDYLLRHASEDQIHQLKEGTPNKFLYVGKVTSTDNYERVVPKMSDDEKEDEKKNDDDNKGGNDAEKQKDGKEDSPNSSSQNDVKTEL
ncbi:extracellular serine proteinase-like [Lytechinus pictus]|uniref:extracellular serine proteinase-like n=1 Tax=Lytechinus pictus TaxID=7653 RepID=UPI0030B9E4C7